MRGVAVLLVIAGCTPAGAPPAGLPPPAPAPPGSLTVTPGHPPPRQRVRLAPQSGRFVAYQRVDIVTEYQGLQTQYLGFRTWFAVVVADSADVSGRLPTVFTIDSLVADSGVALPADVNLYAARGLTVTGWLTPTGVFEDRVFSDSVAAQRLSRLLGFFGRFFPSMPGAGVLPGDSWTDSMTVTEPGVPATLTRTSIVESHVGAWETLDGLPALRLEVREAYQVTGSGDGGGQPVELSGSGARTGSDFLGVDGRYLGGTGRDSASFSINLPAQGLTIPQRQVSTVVITVLPQ